MSLRSPAWIGMAAVLVGLTQVACGTAGDPDDTVRRFLEAHRAHRVSVALAILADDPAIELPDGRQLAGREALRALFQWDSATAQELTIESFDVHGDMVVAGPLVQRSVWLWLLGVGELAHHPGTEFVVRDGRIASIRLAPLEPAAREALDRGLADFIPWAEHEYPDRLRRIRPAGEFVFGAAPAADWLALLREWRRGER